jgi:hypothetical protein
MLWVIKWHLQHPIKVDSVVCKGGEQICKNCQEQNKSHQKQAKQG